MIGVSGELICAVVLGLMLAQDIGVELPGSAPCDGWQAGPERVVTQSDIFDYMNGAGELYLAYGFRDLRVRLYSKPGQPSITVELYRMPSSQDAYGLFSQDRSGESLKIGQGAVCASGLLMAWQGSYFLRAVAEKETAEAKECLIALAKQVVKLCGPPGKLPEALAWLPKTGLDPRSVHFFHIHALLNYFHFVSTENILNLSTSTDAVMGTYVGKAGKSLALVVGYPKESEARAAWAKFQRAYLAGLKPQGDYSLVRLENGKWLAGMVKDRKMLLVLESGSWEDCSALIRALERQNASTEREKTK